MVSYDIGIKGGEFISINGSLKSSYNNYDELNFINYDIVSPIINIYKKEKGNYTLNASSGYITHKGIPSFSDYITYTFNYTLAYTGDFEVFIVNPVFIEKGYSYSVEA